MENNDREKVTSDILISVGFTPHKVIIGDTYNFIKGGFRMNTALPRTFFYNEEHFKIVYLDELEKIYFEKTGEKLTPNNLLVVRDGKEQGIPENVKPLIDEYFKLKRINEGYLEEMQKNKKYSMDISKKLYREFKIRIKGNNGVLG